MTQLLLAALFMVCFLFCCAHYNDDADLTREATPTTKPADPGPEMTELDSGK